MKLEISKPNLTEIEIKTYSLIGLLNGGDLAEAKICAEELAELVRRQQSLKNEWKDLFFEIANKL